MWIFYRSSLLNVGLTDVFTVDVSSRSHDVITAQFTFQSHRGTFYLKEHILNCNQRRFIICDSAFHLFYSAVVSRYSKISQQNEKKTQEFYLRDVLSCFSEQLACEQLASAELPVWTANCCWLVSTVSLAARGYYDNKLCLICICFGF